MDENTTATLNVLREEAEKRTVALTKCMEMYTGDEKNRVTQKLNAFNHAVKTAEANLLDGETENAVYTLGEFIANADGPSLQGFRLAHGLLLDAIRFH